MRESNTVLLATTNLDKYEEFKAIFVSYPKIKLVPAQEIIRNAGKIGHVETYATYLENALAKARVANHASHYPCIADDSGIEVAALKGAPGPRSARYAAPQPGVSQSQANVQKLLEELRGKRGDERRVKCVTTLALVMEGICLHAVGELDCLVTESPRGEHGFGYDPILMPVGFDKTFAELSIEEKSRISHRAKATHALMQLASSHQIHFARP